MNEELAKMTAEEPRAGLTVWLTGLSGAGKTTVASLLQEVLRQRKLPYCLLDGDRVRTGLSADLGFSVEDRRENIRRVAEVAKIGNELGAIALVALVSPLRADRDLARLIVGGSRFVEVFVDAPVSVCAGRDPKGLYRRAFAGEIKDFTGVSAAYEAPLAPSLHLRTDQASVADCLEQVAALFDGLLPGTTPPTL